MAWQGSKSASGAPTSQTATTEPAPGGAVTVKVGGVKLSLKSDKDPKLVAEIAAYVNDKVGMVRDAAPSAPLDKALMLASLTVAEELFEAQSRLRELEQSMQERVSACLAVLDDIERDSN